MFLKIKQPLISVIMEFLPVEQMIPLLKLNKLLAKNIKRSKMFVLYFKLFNLNKDKLKHLEEHSLLTNIAIINSNNNNNNNNNDNKVLTIPDFLFSNNNNNNDNNEHLSFTLEESNSLISQFLNLIFKEYFTLSDRCSSKYAIKLASLYLSSFQCHFRSIKWKNICLNDNDSCNFVEALSLNKSVKEIELAHCSLNFEMLKQALTKNKTLETLKINVFNFYKRTELENLICFNNNNNNNLKSFNIKNLHFNKIFLTNDNLTQLETFLINFKTLQSLAFDFIDLEDNYKFSKYFTSCKTKSATFLNLIQNCLISDNCTLKEFSFQGNIVSNNDNCSIKQLTDILRFNQSLEKLNLMHNKINETQKQALKEVCSSVDIIYK